MSAESHPTSTKEKELQAVDSAANNEEESSSDSDTEAVEGETPDAILQPGGELSSTSSNKKKKKKKKKSKMMQKLKKKLGAGEDVEGQGNAAVGGAGGDGAEVEVPKEVLDTVRMQVEADLGKEAAGKVNMESLMKVMRLLNLERESMLRSQESKQKGQKAIADHKFWKTQPVAKPGEGPITEEGPIEPSVPREQVRQEPYPLPKDFQWVTIDIDNETELKEVYDLLSANYVEDDDASLRFNYSAEFLEWVLKHPGYHKSWHVGIRAVTSGKLLAFISGIPTDLRVRKQKYISAEINFLCVHKKLRSKRLAPVLIKEVTRRCHLEGIFQAIYTAGVVLPTPISCARYYHRSLNPQKLLDIGFSALPEDMPLDRFIKRFKVPTETTTPGLREMEAKDVEQVGRLLRRYLRRYDMAPDFTDEEVAHVLLSGKGEEVDGKREKQVTWTYVVEDPTAHTITDFFSFYSLPSTVIHGEGENRLLYAAYLFYYATDAAFATPTSSQGASTSEEPELDPRWEDESPEIKAGLKQRLNSLMEDMLILAKQNNFDVVNCLTVMDNQLFIDRQKFGPGDGFLRYYLYNWRVFPVAGGMGNRAGETELDPAFQYANREKVLSDKNKRGEFSVEELRSLRANMPRPELGSGLGVVML